MAKNKKRKKGQIHLQQYRKERIAEKRRQEKLIKELLEYKENVSFQDIMNQKGL